mmetsp:Transcript_45789/g.83939  ORF Transcript_45789/g.83939 Transcript_45789/m.83939 type:complete len:302 (-) Transcript_45789:128-1033(-)
MGCAGSGHRADDVVATSLSHEDEDKCAARSSSSGGPSSRYRLSPGARKCHSHASLAAPGAELQSKADSQDPPKMGGGGGGGIQAVLEGREAHQFVGSTEEFAVAMQQQRVMRRFGCDRAWQVVGDIQLDHDKDKARPISRRPRPIVTPLDLPPMPPDVEENSTATSGRTSARRKCSAPDPLRAAGQGLSDKLGDVPAVPRLESLEERLGMSARTSASDMEETFSQGTWNDGLSSRHPSVVPSEELQKQLRDLLDHKMAGGALFCSPFPRSNPDSDDPVPVLLQALMSTTATSPPASARDRP